MIVSWTIVWGAYMHGMQLRTRRTRQSRGTNQIEPWTPDLIRDVIVKLLIICWVAVASSLLMPKTLSCLVGTGWMVYLDQGSNQNVSGSRFRASEIPALLCASYVTNILQISSLKVQTYSKEKPPESYGYTVIPLSMLGSRKKPDVRIS